MMAQGMNRIHLWAKKKEFSISSTFVDKLTDDNAATLKFVILATKLLVKRILLELRS